MRVYNYSGDSISIEAHKSAGALDIAPYPNTAFYLTYRGHRDLALGLDVHIWAYKNPMSLGVWKSGMLSRAATFIIYSDGSDLGFCNWTEVEAKWRGQAEKRRSESDAIAPGIEIATAILSALVTGIAATGTKGALPSSLLLGVGSLLLIGLDAASGQSPPPPPPRLAEIEEAIEVIVHEESLKSDAGDRANRMYAASAWLLSKAGTAHSQLLRSSDVPTVSEISKHDYMDYTRNLENFQDESGEFQIDFSKLCSHPEVSRYVLPAFCIGISSALQIHRLHDFLRKLDGVRMSDEDLKLFLEKVKISKNGLVSARQSLEEKVNANIAKEHVPHLAWDHQAVLRRIMLRKLTGSETLDFVDGFIAGLESIERDVGTDIQLLRSGQPMQHYWKVEWDTHERAPKPV
jgi:hypothetical protein